MTTRDDYEKRPVKESPPKFVSSRDIPDRLSEALAFQRHKRACGSFDGGRANRAVAAPPFKDQHRARDILWASIALADICNTFGLPLSELENWVARKKVP